MSGNDETGAARGPQIATRRLRLGPLETGDAAAIYAYRSDPEVARYQSFVPADVREVDRLVHASRTTPFGTPGEWTQLGIRLRGDETLVGDIGVRVLVDDPRQVEIGISVSPAHQRCGYGREALGGLLDHLFGALGKHRAIASVDPSNSASVKLMESVGMRQEAHHRSSLWFRGEWVDDLIFAILASEWND